MTRAEVLAAVLAEHQEVGENGWSECSCRPVSMLPEDFLTHVAAVLDAALAAQEGERGGAEVAVEWASNYDYRPHPDRATAEKVQARFGGHIYVRQRTSFPDVVTEWQRADRIAGVPVVTNLGAIVLLTFGALILIAAALAASDRRRP